MARWRLLTAHYLNVPGTEWEYTELSQATGKQARRKFIVPLFLNPEDPADHNYKQEASIIVCHEDRGESRDIIFIGEPTPDMEPVDDEAIAISDSLRDKWKHPIETLPGQSYSQSLLDKFQTEVADRMSRPSQIAGMEELTKSISEMAKQNAELIKAISGSTLRRV